MLRGSSGLDLFSLRGTAIVAQRAGHELENWRATKTARTSGRRVAMLREARVELEAAHTCAQGAQAEPEWQSVHQALRRIARRRAGLDAEEARWLREAVKLRIWRQLGMVSVFDYMERVMGYGPRAAQERLRVAGALGALPILSEALAQGELSFSAVRELTRVA